MQDKEQMFLQRSYETPTERQSRLPAVTLSRLDIQPLVEYSIADGPQKHGRWAGGCRRTGPVDESGKSIVCES